MKAAIISRVTPFRATFASRLASRCRPLGIALAAATAMIASPQVAHATTGCTQLNGSAGPHYAQVGPLTASDFSAGDIITIKIVNPPGKIGLYDATERQMLVNYTTAESLTYTVPADTTNEFAVFIGDNSLQTVITWSCAEAPPPQPPGPTGPTDSQKLNSITKTVVPLTAGLSAQTMTSSVDAAINDAFSDGGAPVTGSENGLRFNFAADPQARRAAQSPAMQALAYATSDNADMTKAPGRFDDRAWSLWADIQGAGFKSNATNGTNGRQINFTTGLGYKLTPDWLIGAIIGYEHYNYDIASLNGSLKGHGATLGSYTAYRLSPTLRWDGMLSWTRVSYDASSGTTSANVRGSRWVGSTGLTGSYRWHSIVIEPSSKVFAMWQRDNAATDTTGTALPSSSYMSGRVATGGRIIYAMTTPGGWNLSPYVGAYGDWRFGSTVTSDVTVSGISQGWSARVTGGVAIARSKAMSLTLGGEFGGIGADYKIWSGRARASVAF